MVHYHCPLSLTHVELSLAVGCERLRPWRHPTTLPPILRLCIASREPVPALSYRRHE